MDFSFTDFNYNRKTGQILPSFKTVFFDYLTRGVANARQSADARRNLD